MLEMRSI